MRNKIKEALKQGYKNLGLNEEALERVATSVETLVTDESDIDKYVKSELVGNLMKFEQADADRKRTAQKKQSEGESKSETATNPEPNPAEPAPQPQDMAKIIAEAVAAAIKPISDELTKFKGEQTAKAALESARSKFFGNDYVKKYSDEATDAWDVAMIEYKYNPEWTTEQINEVAMGRFNKAVSKKGVDTSKPFESDGSSKQTPDFSADVEFLKGEGVEFAE